MPHTHKQAWLQGGLGGHLADTIWLSRSSVHAATHDAWDVRLREPFEELQTGDPPVSQRLLRYGGSRALRVETSCLSSSSTTWTQGRTCNLDPKIKAARGMEAPGRPKTRDIRLLR